MQAVSTRPSVVERLLPGVALMRRYQRSWLRPDIIAGITVAAYLVPQVMAYAEVAGLPPVVGLWAAVAPLALYAFFGSSRQLSSGPESTTAIMTAAAIAPLAAGDLATYAALAAALALVVGVLCLLAGVARLGFLADLLSRPVLVGYMAGIALIMIASQLGKTAGVDAEGDGFFGEVAAYLSNLDQVNWPTAGITVGVLLFLFLVSWRLPKLPTPLLAVLLAALVVAVFNLESAGVAVVGEIPSGLPSVEVPNVDLDDVVGLLPAALGITIVAYNDNILTARAFAIRNRYRVDANQEWIGLGMSNLGAGLLQGFPVSSSGSRTALGDSLRSKSQVYSLVTLAGLLAVLLFLSGLLATFPSAALGAIVIYAATRLVDVPAFRALLKFRKSEFALALATTTAVLAFDILYGVLFAVALSLLDLLARVARPHAAVLGRVPGLAGMHDVDDYPSARTVPGLVVFRYDSPLFFANAENFRRRSLAAVDAETARGPEPVHWFLLNAEANVEIDATAAAALEDVRQALAERDVIFALARLKHELYEQLERAGLIDAIGTDRVFPTLPTALLGYEAWRERQGLPPTEGRGLWDPWAPT